MITTQLDYSDLMVLPFHHGLSSGVECNERPWTARAAACGSIASALSRPAGGSSR